MRHYLVIGLLFSCALAVSALPAQSDPDRHVDVGPPPLLLVFDGSNSDVQPAAVFTIESRAYYTAAVDQSPVADTTTKRQPEGPSIHAHKPAQDDYPLRARNTVVSRSNNNLLALPKRLPALHLSQAWSVPHREGQLHRTTHY